MRDALDTMAKQPPSMPKPCRGQLISELFVTLFRIKIVRNDQMRAIVQMHGKKEATNRAVSDDA